jgi:RNase P subunit RPR2
MRAQEEMIRRANLHSGANRKKRVYSSKYALSSMVYCSKCGEIYRRIAWNNRGKHSIVWRCCTRVEHGPEACDAETIQEDDLQMVTVRAINQAVQCSEPMLKTLQENLDEVINSETEKEMIDIANELAVQQEALLKATRAKQPYDDIADAIEALRDRKQKVLTEKAETEGRKLRIDELKTFLSQMPQEITEYDEQIVRKYIEKITVYDEYYDVEFKAGIKIKIKK